MVIRNKYLVLALIVISNCFGFQWIGESWIGSKILFVPFKFILFASKKSFAIHLFVSELRRKTNPCNNLNSTFLNSWIAFFCFRLILPLLLQALTLLFTKRLNVIFEFIKFAQMFFMIAGILSLIWQSCMSLFFCQI